jgi:hypothetical protein
MEDNSCANRRRLSFFYTNESQIQDYRKSIVDYLKRNENAFKEIGEPRVIIEFHDFDKRENPNPSGHLYIQDLEDNSNQFERVCRYVLSKNRKFIPLVFS